MTARKQSRKVCMGAVVGGGVGSGAWSAKKARQGIREVGWEDPKGRCYGMLPPFEGEGKVRGVCVCVCEAGAACAVQVV